MRLVRVGEFGKERSALLADDQQILELPESFGDIDANFWNGNRLEEIQRLLQVGGLRKIVAESVRLGAPIAKPEKVICIGLNYRDHANETENSIPEEPILFMKAPNCVVGPNDQILIPRGSAKTDWEVELGVVIGRRARYLETPNDAHSVIGGYCLSNDVSERDFQFERGGQWDKGKCCETFNPLGPWLVTADEIANPQNLGLRLSVNGAIRQNGSTSCTRER